MKDGSREGREGRIDGGRRWEMGNRGEGERGGWRKGESRGGVMRDEGRDEGMDGWMDGE